MRKILFKVWQELGTHVYYDDGTCEYIDVHTSKLKYAYAWRFHEGKVRWRDNEGQGFWFLDDHIVQSAYLKYINGLIVGEER